MTVRFVHNLSAFDDVDAHLTACAASFAPPLDHRVVIADYARKLLERAERFEAWDGSVLVGLVAIYCNDPTRNEAFVTSVSVMSAWARLGIGRQLLESGIQHARKAGFQRLALCVDPDAAARSLYQALGFRPDAASHDAERLLHDLRAVTIPENWPAPLREAAQRLEV